MRSGTTSRPRRSAAGKKTRKAAAKAAEAALRRAPRRTRAMAHPAPADDDPMPAPEEFETLHEIDIEARKHAESAGITEFHMMPALNDSPLLIRALADLVLRSVGVRFGVASLTT